MKKILYVENDDINAFVLLKMLRKSKDVSLVNTGPEAMAIMRKHHFDLIILDIHLGRDQMNGIELCGLIKANPEWKHIPIMALTAYAMPGNQEQFLDAGFDNVVCKPFERKELIAEIEQMLNQPLTSSS
ncbi:MAG: response regulator [Bacteroidota bacterium]